MKTVIALLLTYSILITGCASTNDSSATRTEPIPTTAEQAQSPEQAQGPEQATSTTDNDETATSVDGTASSVTESQSSSSGSAESSTTTTTETTTSSALTEDSSVESDESQSLNASGDLAVGEVRVARDVTAHCGLNVIYLPIAGTFWEASSPTEGDVPEEWAASVRDQAIDLVIERLDATTLSVTALGTEHSLTYVPTASPPLCD